MSVFAHPQMAETPKPWHGRNSAAEAGNGQVRHGQERVPEAFQAREPFWREPCAGTNLNRRRSAAHGSTPTPVLRPEAAGPIGEWQPGRGTWNRTAKVRRMESLVGGYCRVDVCRSERRWATSFISAGSLAIIITRISEGYPRRFRFRSHSFCRCSSRCYTFGTPRESHENSFSSSAPSLNRRLCRQTMDHPSPPLCRRIPEGPRT